ncbi:hypothetical protein BGZ63DRAFT_429584 [Mariannaea sp. PMI_226]|nr:hypothetical protein BGZ63DRAFT_429584 [Mariannaea sp. PMI_226]
MRQHVYGPVIARANTNNRMNNIGDTIPSTLSNPQTNINSNATPRQWASMVTSKNLIEDVDQTYIKSAEKIMQAHIRDTDFGDDIRSFDVYEPLQVQVTIVAEYMSINDGENMPKDILDGIIACFESGSNEDIEACVEIFGDAVMNRSSLVQFIEMIKANID